jgi:hypothetical protein
MSDKMPQSKLDVNPIICRFELDMQQELLYRLVIPFVSEV